MGELHPRHQRWEPAPGRCSRTKQAGLRGLPRDFLVERIAEALGTLTSPLAPNLPHKDHGYDTGCPVCCGSVGAIASAVVDTLAALTGALPAPSSAPQAEADEWNRRHPVGTTVTYRPGGHADEEFISRTRTPAWVAGGHAVVSVYGHPGGLPLAYVSPLPNATPITPGELQQISERAQAAGDEDALRLIEAYTEAAGRIQMLHERLDEMTALRDNAVRHAYRFDAKLGIDLEGGIGDAVAELPWEWDESGGVPDELVEAAASAVRPYIARLEEQVARLRLAWDSARRGRRELRAQIAVLRADCEQTTWGEGETAAEQGPLRAESAEMNDAACAPRGVSHDD